MEETQVIKRRGRPPGSTKPKTDAVVFDDGKAEHALDPQPAKSSEFQRVYKTEQELDHDLFKLDVAKMTKDMGYNPDDPQLVQIEHCHFFHSIDSRGRKQEVSSKVGGHFHKVIINPDGTALCSPPLIEIKRRNPRTGRTYTSQVELELDRHTHPMTYIGSEKIKPIGINPEFAKLQVAVAERETKYQHKMDSKVFQEGD